MATDPQYLLAKAVIIAQNALKQDFHPPKGDFRKAHALYIEVVALLSENLLLFPMELHPIINEKIRWYENRSHQLNFRAINESSGIQVGRHGRVEKSGKKSETPPLEFVEDRSLGTKFRSLPPPPPDASDLRVVWVMNILCLSIQQGAFLTTKIWVPREVWFQSDVQISAQLDKMASLRYLQELMARLPRTFSRDLATVNELLLVSQDLHIIQNHLAFLLDCVPEVKVPLESSKDKKIYAQRTNMILERLRLLKTDPREGDGGKQEYAETVAETFKIGTVLENLLKASKTAEGVVLQDSAKQICSFFIVVVGWVLEDLAIMLREFFKKSKLSFLEAPVLPVGLNPR